MWSKELEKLTIDMILKESILKKKDYIFQVLKFGENPLKQYLVE